MIRALCRLCLIAVAACALLIVGITALAGGRSADYFAFYGINQSDCARACFMGIRIGVSTMDDVDRLLRAHPWVGDVREAVHGDALIWGWNGSQPPFVTRYAGDQFVGRVQFRDGVASNLYVVTGMRLGEVIGMYGFPESRFFITRVSATAVQLIQSAAYFDYGFEVETTSRCPVRRQSSLWYAYTTVRLPTRSRALYESVPSSWSC